MINIEAIPAFNDNYLWLGKSVEDGTAFVVDPGDAKPILEALDRQKLTLTDILITHHHADHIGGVQELKEKFPNVNVFGPSTDRFKQLITHSCQESDTITLATNNTKFKILSLPGHTLDHIGFYTNGTVFVGDTLFSAGCGRLFEGTPQQMLSSLKKLATLPKETLVYCAHEYTLANINFAETVNPNWTALSDYKNDVVQKRKSNTPSIPTTIEQQVNVNPFLRCHSQEIKSSIKNKFDLPSQPNEQACFALLRKWKDNF